MADSIRVHKAFTVVRPAAELYDFWRNFENFPLFMKHVESVEILDERRSRWTVRAPADRTVSFDAEILSDEPGRRIVWGTVGRADVDHRGEIRFRPATGGRGTVVEVQLDYDPPAGNAGAAVAKLFGEEPEQQVQDDLRRFKQLVETGEIPTTEGQPAARDDDEERGREEKRAS